MQLISCHALHGPIATAGARVAVHVVAIGFGVVRVGNVRVFCSGKLDGVLWPQAQSQLPIVLGVGAVLSRFAQPQAVLSFTLLTPLVTPTVKERPLATPPSMRVATPANAKAALAAPPAVHIHERPWPAPPVFVAPVK